MQLAAMALASGGSPLARVGLRFVMVDDNPGFLRAARVLLEQEGLRVVGTATMPKRSAWSPSCVPTSRSSTSTSVGRAASTSSVAWPRIPGSMRGRLILVSAHAEEDLLDLIEASPAVGFLDKPALSVAAIEWLLDGNGGGAAGRPGPSAG
jgi:hypothetical protein